MRISPFTDILRFEDEQTLFLALLPIVPALIIALVTRFCARNWHIDAMESERLIERSKGVVLLSAALGALSLFVLNINAAGNLFGFLSLLSWQFDSTHILALLVVSLCVFLGVKSYADPLSWLMLVGAVASVTLLFEIDLPYRFGAAWCLSALGYLLAFFFLRWRLIPADPELPPTDWIQRIYDRGPQFISAPQALWRFIKQSYLSSEPLIRVGDQWLNVDTLSGNLMLPGAPGTGKTIVLRLMMQSVLSRIRPGSNQRAVIFDAKREQISVVTGIAPKAPMIILNPFDERGAVWDLARDFKTPSDALQLSKLFLPDNPKEADAFWSKSSRGLLTDIILAHIYALRDGSIPHWSLSDLIRSLQSKDEIEKALAMSEQTKDSLRNIHEEKIYHGVLATLDLVRREFETLGALWDKPSNDPARLFSLGDWIRGSGVIILGPTVTAEAVVNPLNRLVLDRIAQLLLDCPDNDQSRDAQKSRTWLFLDEFPRLDRMPRIENLMTNGRSKGVIAVLAFQDLSELKDPQLYGEHFANVIVGACTHKIFFQASSHAHATWCSDTLGAKDVVILSKSHSVTLSPNGTSTTIGYSASEKTRPLFTKDEFLYLGKPGQPTPIREFPNWLRFVHARFIPDALLNFYRTSCFAPIRAIAVIQGLAFPMTLPFTRSISELTRKCGPDMIPRPDSDQFFEKWPRTLQNETSAKSIEAPTIDISPSQSTAPNLKEALFRIFTPKQKPQP